MLPRTPAGRTSTYDRNARCRCSSANANCCRISRTTPPASCHSQARSCANPRRTKSPSIASPICETDGSTPLTNMYLSIHGSIALDDWFPPIVMEQEQPVVLHQALCRLEIVAIILRPNVLEHAHRYDVVVDALCVPVVLQHRPDRQLSVLLRDVLHLLL